MCKLIELANFSCETGQMYICSHCFQHSSMYVIYNVATCKIEDAIKNEKVKVEPASNQYVQDDQVIIACDSEYQMVNSSKSFIVRICLSDQTWSGIDPQCVKSENSF